MNLDFRAAIAALGEGAAFRIANAARPMGDYLFNSLLPEQQRPTYNVDGGSMTIRSTMAGLVGMDSPYPPSGYVELSSFLEKSAKLANEVKLTEEVLRHLQDFIMRLRLGGGNSNEAMANEVLNFLDKIVLQPHLDAMEWMRGQALVNGAIDWTFNGKNLLVDYGIPAANMLAPAAGANGYGGATSQFWADIRSLRRQVKGLRAIIAHPDTIDMARYNTANAMATVAEGSGSITFRRFVRDQAGNVLTGAFSQDTGDQVTIITYDKEGELLNPADPNSTVIKPFMERGKLLAIGNAPSSGYVVGQGTASQDPNEANRLGYTHLAPTVEGGGRPGRWSDVYTPENAPWSLHGRAVTNGLPVIEAPTKIAVATTDMA